MFVLPPGSGRMWLVLLVLLADAVSVAMPRGQLMKINLAALLYFHLALVDRKPTVTGWITPLHMRGGCLPGISKSSVVLVRLLTLDDVGLICVEIAICMSPKRSLQDHLISWLQ